MSFRVASNDGRFLPNPVPMELFCVTFTVAADTPLDDDTIDTYARVSAEEVRQALRQWSDKVSKTPAATRKTLVSMAETP